MATNRTTAPGVRFWDGVGNALEVFHAQFALMSGHSADTTRIEAWEHYRAQLDDRHVTPTAVANLRALWAHAHADRAADHRADDADDDMRAAVEHWFDRAQRRLGARPGWAPTEPARW
jgi:hypothetical protein